MTQAEDMIVNPRTGQHMFFLRRARDTDGKLLRIETVNLAHGTPEPEHVHVRQESRIEVLAGALRVRVRSEERTVHAGEKIVIPPNTPHSFWNDGVDDARAIQEFRPAPWTEDFFELLFSLACDGKLNENGMPSLLQLAVMVPAFGEEIRPTSPPWPLLRAITWLLEPVARLLGYRRIYPPAERSMSAGTTA